MNNDLKKTLTSSWIDKQLIKTIDIYIKYFLKSINILKSFNI